MWYFNNLNSGDIVVYEGKQYIIDVEPSFEGPKGETCVICVDERNEDGYYPVYLMNFLLDEWETQIEPVGIRRADGWFSSFSEEKLRRETHHHLRRRTVMDLFTGLPVRRARRAAESCG